MNELNHIVLEKNGRLLEIFDTTTTQCSSIVFVHGAGSNASQFKAELKSLGKDFRVIALTLHGHSSHFKDHKFYPDAFALDKLAGDIILCMDALEIECFHLIGNSAGGVVGLELAKMVPERLLSLCTFGTVGKLSLGKLVPRVISGIDRFMIAIAPDAYLGFAANRSSNQPLVREKIKELLMDSRHATPFIRSQIGNYDYLDVIRTMERPYLLMQCAFDSEINKFLGETLAAVEANPQAKTVFLEGAGHVANLDQPEMFIKFLKAHLYGAEQNGEDEQENLQ